MNDVTRLLSEVEQGDADAAHRLLPMVYGELRQLAAAKLSHERPRQTLQATALVHEAYLRLVDVNHQQRWDTRNHFFAAAAEAMRRILIEQARRKASLKRGGQCGVQPLEVEIAVSERPDAILALDESLARLEQEDPQSAQLVKLRYFTGLTTAQAGEVLGVSKRTAERLFAYARAWLFRDLQR